MNVIEAAEQAGMTRRPADRHCRLPYWDAVIDPELERFAQIIRNQALEDAALECDGVYYQHLGPEYGEVRYGIAACSTAIRSMKKEQPNG